jgi:hypothetical protein
MWSLISFVKRLVTEQCLAVSHGTTCVDKTGRVVAPVFSLITFSVGLLEGENLHEEAWHTTVKYHRHQERCKISEHS